MNNTEMSEKERVLRMICEKLDFDLTIRDRGAFNELYIKGTYAGRLLIPEGAQSLVFEPMERPYLTHNLKQIAVLMGIIEEM